MRLLIEGIFQKLHEAGVARKANSVFAKFGQLQSTSNRHAFGEDIAFGELTSDTYEPAWRLRCSMNSDDSGQYVH